jgi:flagellar biosynthesis protein FliQ
VDAASVIDISTQALMLAAKLSAPVLITSLVIGFVISVFQSITQIQEATLAFVPKAVGAAIALLVCGQWMIQETVTFTQSMFELIPSLLGQG